MCECVCVCARERECVCVCVREREREYVCVCIPLVEASCVLVGSHPLAPPPEGVAGISCQTVEEVGKLTEVEQLGP